MTAGGAGPALAAQELDELGALALGEAADRLRRRDPALGQDPVRLDPAVLRDREDHVEGLRREHVLRRVEEQRLDLRLAGLQVALQLGARRADVVGSPQGLHPLVVCSFRNGG